MLDLDQLEREAGPLDGWSQDAIYDLLRYGRKMSGSWDDYEDGGIPGEGCVGLIMALPELLARARRADALEALLRPSDTGGELLPCPFCACANPLDMDDQPTYLPTLYRIWCPRCHARSHWFQKPTDAVVAWNRRAAPAPITPTDLVRLAQLQNPD